jgi:serine/threonine protein kinase
MDDSSAIYRGYYLGLEVGIKVYNLNKLDDTEKKHFISEITLFISLKHPNIVSFIGISKESHYFSIVTEYMKQQSLKLVLDNKNIFLKESQLINFCIEASLAIWYMHTREPPVLHRDIKSSNCLLDDFFKLKLCDLGLSKIFDKNFKKTDTKANTYWMSPESLLDNIFTEKSDIYSLGILFWEIMHRDTIPYKDFSETCFYFEENLRTIRPKIDSKVNSKMESLIRSCWEYESEKRPNIEEIVSKLQIIKNETVVKENSCLNSNNLNSHSKKPFDMSCSKINKSSKENKNRISDDFYRKTEESTGNQLSVQSEEY